MKTESHIDLSSMTKSVRERDQRPTSRSVVGTGNEPLVFLKGKAFFTSI